MQCMVAADVPSWIEAAIPYRATGLSRMEIDQVQAKQQREPTEQAKDQRNDPHQSEPIHRGGTSRHLPNQ